MLALAIGAEQWPSIACASPRSEVMSVPSAIANQRPKNMWWWRGNASRWGSLAGEIRCTLPRCSAARSDGAGGRRWVRRRYYSQDVSPPLNCKSKAGDDGWWWRGYDEPVVVGDRPRKEKEPQTSRSSALMGKPSSGVVEGRTGGLLLPRSRGCTTRRQINEDNATIKSA